MRNISKAAWLASEYVKDQVADTSSDAVLPGIYLAVIEAQSHEEGAALGEALLCRNESLADAPYKFGGAMYDPRLLALAAALGWKP